MTLIALLILLVSLVGMGVVIFRKISVLTSLVPVVPEQIKTKLFEEITEKIKRNSFFPVKKILEKVLSKFRVLTLKTEHKTSNLLIKLRQKSIEERNKFSEDYWKKVKRKK